RRRWRGAGGGWDGGRALGGGTQAVEPLQRLGACGPLREGLKRLLCLSQAMLQLLANTRAVREIDRGVCRGQLQNEPHQLGKRSAADVDRHGFGGARCRRIDARRWRRVIDHDGRPATTSDDRGTITTMGMSGSTSIGIVRATETREHVVCSAGQSVLTTASSKNGVALERTARRRIPAWPSRNADRYAGRSLACPRRSSHPCTVPFTS